MSPVKKFRSIVSFLSRNLRHAAEGRLSSVLKEIGHKVLRIFKCSTCFFVLERCHEPYLFASFAGKFASEQQRINNNKKELSNGMSVMKI